MDITDIVMTEFVEVDVDERLAKVRAKFEEANPRGVIVTDDGYENITEYPIELVVD